MQNSLRDGACPSCGLKIPGRWNASRVDSPGFAKAVEKLGSEYDALNL
jgi:hypothetical protein